MKPLSDEAWMALVREAVEMPASPSLWVAKALKIFPANPSPVTSTATTFGSMVQSLFAVLKFDSWAAQPAMAGLRALPSDVQQLMFSAQDIDIELRISPQGEGFEVAGQVFGFAEPAAIEWQQDSSPEEVGLVTLNHAQEFRLIGLEPGSCRLRLRWPRGDVTLPALELGRAERTRRP